MPPRASGSGSGSGSEARPPPPGHVRHTVVVSFHVDAPGALLVELARVLEGCAVAACGGERERVVVGQSARVGEGRTKVSQGRPECVELGVQMDAPEAEASARVGAFLARAARAVGRRHLACSRPERLAPHLSRLVVTPTPTFLRILRGEVDVVSDPRVYREAAPAQAARARALLAANPGVAAALRDARQAFAVVSDVFAGDEGERTAFHTDMTRVAAAYDALQAPPPPGGGGPSRGDRVVFPSEEDAAAQELEAVGRMIVLLKCVADALGADVAGGRLLVPLRAELSALCEPGSGRARHGDDGGAWAAVAGPGASATLDLGSFPRAVSCVTFGNLAWDPALHGGLLRLYHKETGRVADVVPEVGTLVLFRPDLVDTEVLPVQRWRTSLSLGMHTVPPPEDSEA